MNKIQKIFDKYDNEFCEYKCKPATEKQIQAFIENCKTYNVPAEIVSELVEYYKLNNNFFDYFECDDSAIFEWYEQDCLWLGQRDL